MLHDVQWSGDAGANAPTLTALLDAVLAAGPACGPTPLTCSPAPTERPPSGGRSVNSEP